MRSNCYAASEALFHILGGKKAGWTPMVMQLADDTHWFLKHETGLILDPSKMQFRFKPKPKYSKARGCGFLTPQPSKRARDLMRRLTWQDED